MVPVENTTRGAASVLHNKTERTPYEHAYKVAHVEQNAYNKEHIVADKAGVIKHAHNGNKSHPEKHYLIGAFRSGDNIAL